MRSIMSSLVRRSLRFSRISSFAPRQLHSSTSFVSASPSSLIKLSSNPSLFHPFQRFSSSSVAAPKSKVSADKKLSKAIQSEIECAEEEKDDDLDQLVTGMHIDRLVDPISKVSRLPDGFPFEVIDKCGEETITLKREYDGEQVKVVVHMPQLDDEEDGEEDKDSDADEDANKDENSIGFSMPLNVTVTKGTEAYLEFNCYASSDGIHISSMGLKGEGEASSDIPYEGPEFTDLDEELQKEFHGYLARRGIESSLTNLLQEYMVNKHDREYMAWLKNVKHYLEK